MVCKSARSLWNWSERDKLKVPDIELQYLSKLSCYTSRFKTSKQNECCLSPNRAERHSGWPIGPTHRASDLSHMWRYHSTNNYDDVGFHTEFLLDIISTTHIQCTINYKTSVHVRLVWSESAVCSLDERVYHSENRKPYERTFCSVTSLLNCYTNSFVIIWHGHQNHLEYSTLVPLDEEAVRGSITLGYRSNAQTISDKFWRIYGHAWSD